GRVKALAHITGGGLLENVPRVLPDGMHAHVDASSWDQPRLMAFLQAQGNIEPEEMARTFNCGIGMVLAVAPDEVDAITADLAAADEKVHRIGDVRAGTKGCSVTGSRGIWSATDDWTATHNG
ncbi:MAG: phosphoribosylformylglycinamidine cyclo-ligase, partial [Sphingomonadales bacterium]|nr:phosphoribosylformylglycinamidine cyclo-ligase [Sphingomonadales bacterium]